MAVDLTGDMSPLRDFFLTEQPEDPQISRERFVLGLR